MTTHFTIDRFSILHQCCLAVGIKAPSRSAQDKPEDWESAIDAAIYLANNRYVEVQSIDLPKGKHPYIRDWVKKRDVESDLSTIADTDLEKTEEIERSTVVMASLFSPELSALGELGRVVMKQYEELTDKLYDLQELAKKTNVVFEMLNDLIEKVQDTSGKPEESKRLRDILQDLRVTVNPGTPPEEDDPLTRTQSELKYYEVVFPEAFHLWRGKLAGQKFGF